MFSSFSEVESFFESRKKLGIKLGLDRIERLLTLLGNPEKNIHAIHVAGTNGKGSTIQYINHALLANGINTGVFTSPSLEGLVGHIQLNNHSISANQFLKTFNRVYPAIEKLDQQQMDPTEFEILTAIAFLYFSEHTDIALIETGMGGREDTTNTIKPILSIITNIEMDHTDFLGSTIESITYHKAGIIKENVPVIVGEVKKNVQEIILKEATRKKSTTYMLNKDFTYQTIDDSHLYWNYLSFTKKKVKIRMKGEHQQKNLSVAMMAIEILRNQGYSIEQEKARKGIEQTIVPGRFELIKENPTIILDTAHNPAGIETLLQTLQTFVHDRKVHIIFAAFKDKDYKKMVTQLSESFSNVTITTFPHPRALTAKDLKEINNDNVTIVSNWKDTLTFEKRADIYVITGSFAFIGLIREHLLMSKKQ